MDPVSAVANAVAAIAGMVAEIVKGQTAEQKAQIWAWYIEDMKWWRGLLSGIQAIVPPPK